MVEVGVKKTAAIAAGIALLCSLMLYASNANALPYVHNDADADGSMGIYDVVVTVDETAAGGRITTAYVPINSDTATVESALNEMAWTSQDKSDQTANADYNYISVADHLSGKTYTVAVYSAASQAPGAASTYTSQSVGDKSYAQLRDGDGIYVTVTK